MSDIDVMEYDEDIDPDKDRTFRFFYILAGPIRYLTTSLTLFLFLTASIGILTVTSQVYGLLLWVALPFLDVIHYMIERMGGKFAAFLISMLLAAFMLVLANKLIIPALAPLAGRVPLPCAATEEEPLRPASGWGCFFNRHYATPALRDKAVRLAKQMSTSFKGMETVYLDASFPFFDFFPMVPHLSHTDGRKLDLAFAWQKRVGEQELETAAYEPAPPPTPFGYWYYEQPTAEEERPCKRFKSHLRWNFSSLQRRYRNYRWDQERTLAMIGWLLLDEDGAPVKKLLLEPHLANRLGLEHEAVKFQGCKAARHDDHFHIEI